MRAHGTYHVMPIYFVAFTESNGKIYRSVIKGIYREHLSIWHYNRLVGKREPK